VNVKVTSASCVEMVVTSIAPDVASADPVGLDGLPPSEAYSFA
jgi:hypothetical protein